MLATAHVNVHYLLILLLPSVAALIMVGLTWYMRVRRRNEAGKKPRASTTTRPRASAAAKPSASASGKPRGSANKTRRGANAKRRPK